MIRKHSIIILSLLLLGGCVQNGPQYRFYTLMATSKATASPLPFSLGVAPVSIPGWLDQTHLVWSRGDVQLFSQNLDRWSESLPDAMTRVLMQDFSRYYNGGRIVSGPWTRSDRPDWVVSVSVLAVNKLQEQLAVDVYWEVSDHEKKVMVSRYQTYSKALENTDSAVEYVQALSHLLSMISNDVAVHLQPLTVK